MTVQPNSQNTVWSSSTPSGATHTLADLQPAHTRTQGNHIPDTGVSRAAPGILGAARPNRLGLEITCKGDEFRARADQGLTSSDQYFPWAWLRDFCLFPLGLEGLGNDESLTKHLFNPSLGQHVESPLPWATPFGNQSAVPASRCPSACAPQSSRTLASIHRSGAANETGDRTLGSRMLPFFIRGTVR